MDVATALTAAQTLFATLQCAEVRKLCAICSYESELQKLLDTVKTVKKCLLDADSKCQELTVEGQHWVENLKEAVYGADDLFDELKIMPDQKILKKVRRFFSSNNQLIFAVNMSKEVKKLREKLDSLAKNHRDFGFSELYQPVKSREDTCSYVYEQNIIGRDADKEAIVDLLLRGGSDDSEMKVSFVTIVGIGGLGKTALAQLVFNDHRINKAFGEENMYWVCVSENFDTKSILGKMIGKRELEYEDLQKSVRDKIEQKRFFLVLDDVWSENGRKWDELRNFLILGGKGTRILVTSRSKKVAGAIGNYPVHELSGLSAEDSWVLFKEISLGQREDETAVAGLVQIGQDIVKKCSNVPLSIRVIASLLRNQDVATWESFKRNDLAKMCGDEDGIMPTLMFSYYHVKELYLYGVDEQLPNWIKIGRVQGNPLSLGFNSSSIFNSIGREIIGSAECIMLSGIEDLGTIREAFRSCASSLRDLDICDCEGLEKLGMEHLTNLQVLTLTDNIEGIPWKSLGSLSSLEIHDIEDAMLPKEIQYLTSLQSLVLTNCYELRSLPEEMRFLTSLSKLVILNPTPELDDRLQDSDGEDWPKVCHIQKLDIYPPFPPLL